MSKQTIYNILAAKAEPVKVELAIGDGLQRKADEVYALAKKVDSLLNNAFSPIREIESAIRKLEANPAATEFQEFVKKLQSLESEYQAEKSKAENMAKELGVALPKMPWMDEVVGVLSYSQRSEETARKDINVYSDVYKSAVSLLSKIK